MRSYALDAIEEHDEQAGRLPAERDVKGFLAKLQTAPETQFEALADGMDARFDCADAAAAALVVDTKVAHLVAFAVDAET